MDKKNIMAIILGLLLIVLGAWLGGIYHKRMLEQEDIKYIQKGNYTKAVKYIEEAFKYWHIKNYNDDYEMVWDILRVLSDVPNGNRLLIKYLQEILEGNYLTREAQSYYLRKIVALSILENDYLTATEHIIRVFNLSEYPNEAYHKGKTAVDLAIISKNLGAYQRAIHILEEIKVTIEDPIKAADLEVYRLINLAETKTILKDYERARLDLEKAYPLVEQLYGRKKEELKIILLTKEAKIAVGQGKVNQANELLKQVNIKKEWNNIKQYPTIPTEYIEVLGEICVATGHYEEAVEIYKGILRQDFGRVSSNSSEIALLQLYGIYQEIGDNEAAKVVEGYIQETQKYWRNFKAEILYDYMLKGNAFDEERIINGRMKNRNFTYVMGLIFAGIFITKKIFLPRWHIKHLENKIRKFIASNNYFLVYQPIIDPTTEHIIGLEALIRLEQNKKIIYPNVLIPEIQKAQMMDKIILWEIHEITKNYDEIQTLFALEQEFYISINVSLGEIIDPIFIQQIKLEAAELFQKGAKICIEITENVGMIDETLIREHITELIAYGFKIAIDDFGVEYANVSMLNYFDFHTLKLDKHFMDNIKESIVVQYIMKVISELSNELEINVVVEGVEEEWQKDYISTFDTEKFYIQGYYYSKPLTLEQLKEYGRTNTL